jgi:hypothetical protein
MLQVGATGINQPTNQPILYKILAGLHDFSYFDVEHKGTNIGICLMEWCTDMPTDGLLVHMP